MAEYKPLARLSAYGLARFSGGHRHGVTRRIATRIAGRRHQLAQDLSCRLRPDFAQLAQSRGQRTAQWGRHGETGQPTFQCLQPTPMSPLLERGVQHQILRNSEREPQSEEAAALRTAGCLSKQREEGS